MHANMTVKYKTFKNTRENHMWSNGGNVFGHWLVELVELDGTTTESSFSKSGVPSPVTYR